MIETLFNFDELVDALYSFGVIGLVEEYNRLQEENEKLNKELKEYRKKGGLRPLRFD